MFQRRRKKLSFGFYSVLRISVTDAVHTRTIDGVAISAVPSGMDLSLHALDQ